MNDPLRGSWEGVYFKVTTGNYPALPNYKGAMALCLDVLENSDLFGDLIRLPLKTFHLFTFV
jgi:hypothetical protein